MCIRDRDSKAIISAQTDNNITNMRLVADLHVPKSVYCVVPVSCFFPNFIRVFVVDLAWALFKPS